MQIKHAIHDGRRGLLAAALALVGSAGLAAPDPAGPWQVVGRQGILLHVIVPAAQARDREAYQREIPAICGGNETCFVNFYTNSTGATLALPLPDAIAAEATAVLRRSAKQGAEGFRWSCRLARPDPGCF
ncbi:MAG TPA: hypothetical protein VLA16_09040 [Ideonella sp.]|nr:hypothetical protein [Ideonella sp.]